jgi:vacuolar-type H+-ATPase subunit E/Vma4
MSSFGKEMILLKDYKVDIPSDLHGLEWIQFKDLEDLKKQLVEQIKQFAETSNYYNKMGEITKDKGDLEKTINYYKRSYLLNPQEEILNELKKLSDRVSKVSKDDRYYALSMRLKDDLKTFLQSI